MTRTAPSTPPELTALWALDALGALGFAYGLAGAVGAIAHPGAALAGFAAIAVAGGALRAVGVGGAAYLGVRSARGTISRLRRAVLLRALSPRGVREAVAGGHGAAVIEEVEAQEGFLARYQPLRQASAVGPVILLVAVAAASWVSALILALTLVPLVVILALVGRAARDAADRQFLALERLSARFADRIRALPLILACQAEGREAAGVAQSAEALSARTLSVLKVAFLSSAALEFFAALSVALVAVYAGFSLLGLLPVHAPERLDLPRALFVLALAPEFYLPLRRLAAAYHDKQVGEAAAARLGPPAAEDPSPPPPPPPQPRRPAPPRVVFDAATVAYDGGAVIGPVSFVAEPGALTALVGPTGSGKSSLLKLLVGLTVCAAGRVTADGRPLDPDEVGGLSLAWVGQAPMILPLTLAQNIGLARPGAGRREIEAAARQAGLGPVLEGRSLGLDTPLDERGSGLSGGERRRIAMARALLKDAPLVLLDEPTADLDAAAEGAFIALIRQMAERRTVLVATHSDALAAVADHVVRLA